MKLGFTGAGVVAKTIAKHVLPFGHKVVLRNSRGPDTLAAIVEELGSGATAATPQEAADQEIVVLAVHWPKVQTALFSIPDWKDRVIVDATNRVAGYSPLALGDISWRTSSEIVAELRGENRQSVQLGADVLDLRLLQHEAAHRSVHRR